MPLSRAAEHFVNGERLDDDSLFVIPRGADFLIRVRKRAHAWCSVALTEDVAAPAVSTKVEGVAGAVSSLREVVRGAVSTLADRPAMSAAHAAAAQAIRDSAFTCLAGRVTPRAAIGRPRLDRTAIMRRATSAIEAAALVPTAGELAQHVGVTNRTLLRAFQESFDVSPKRYLLLREMHAVRRSLCSGDPTVDTVADVLTRHGIWEFGRFAARYRVHFGELPSQTLHRSRA